MDVGVFSGPVAAVRAHEGDRVIIVELVVVSSARETIGSEFVGDVAVQTLTAAVISIRVEIVGQSAVAAVAVVLLVLMLVAVVAVVVVVVAAVIVVAMLAFTSIGCRSLEDSASATPGVIAAVLSFGCALTHSGRLRRSVKYRVRDYFHRSAPQTRKYFIYIGRFQSIPISSTDFHWANRLIDSLPVYIMHSKMIIIDETTGNNYNRPRLSFYPCNSSV